MAYTTEDVAMTLQPPPKPKRRSALAGVKQLAERVTAKSYEVEKARRQHADAATRLGELQAEYAALTDAYDLVKPQPRTRRKV